ncbi:hypothetical protein E1267_22505 [Nonomuraea longispora]|uniref:Uncharacterized protein n=1 Tax=Nonomuraea longispora TaxID=1848320 RepID=A0A4R4N6P2_9ACTN|nr:hypothetical protein [Nonomuraea longispora]TDC04508.1 hypothetical protein E1267_22505 [Nonomuraea longispora]
MNALRQSRWPILLLMVLSPLLAEVFSGSMPATDFFQPGMFFPFTIFVYGLPILVLREVATRAKTGPIGLWCLGMIYGLYNEGLISETLFHPLDPANDAYGTLGVVAGLRIPWALYILPWHGLFSLLTPVLLTHLLFPRQADSPWLPKRATWMLAIVTGGLAIARFVFWGENRGVQDGATFLLHLAAVLGAALVAYVVAMRLPRVPRVQAGADRPGARWLPFASGAGLYAIWFVGTEMLVSVVKAPWPVVVLYTSVAVVAGLWAVARIAATTRAAAAVFVLGAGTTQAAVIVLLIGLLAGDAFRALSGVVFVAAYLGTLALVIRRQGRAGQSDGTVSPRDQPRR